MSRGRMMLGSMAVALVVPLGGCSAPPDVDGVLWRQIIQYKDAMWPALDEVRSAGADAVRAAIDSGAILNGPHWDGVTDPADFELDEGGVVTFDYAENPFRLGLIIASGERDPASDPDGDYEYAGPGAWHTCATLTFEVPDEPTAYYGQRAEIALEDVACPPELVATLPNGSQLQPIHTFDG